MIDEIHYLDQINNETKLKNVIDHYDDIYEVNLAYIDILIKNNHYDNALERINQSLLNERRDHVIEEYHNKKKQIYSKQGDKVHYLEELQDLFMIYNPGNLDLYHELKQNYSKEQWLKIFCILALFIKKKECIKNYKIMFLTVKSYINQYFILMI